MLKNLLILTTLLIFSCLINGCSPPEKTTPQKTNSHQHHKTPKNTLSKDAQSDSLFEITAQWKNQDNNPFQFKDLKGKVTVLTMAYTRCTFTCPVITSSMKKIELKAEKALGQSPSMVLVSLEPKHDTPKVLKAFTRKRELKTPPWMLLQGTESDVRELSAVLGINYSLREDGEIDHGVVIAVVDSEGQILYRHEGLKGAVNSVYEKVINTQ